MNLRFRFSATFLFRLNSRCCLRIETQTALFAYIEEADQQGVQIYLTAAGFSAALPGVVAAKTLRPVLGIPVPVGPLQGIDALLSIVQLPSGIPVGGVPLGAHGPKNAALLAAHILALHDEEIASHVAAYRKALNSG